MRQFQKRLALLLFLFLLPLVSAVVWNGTAAVVNQRGCMDLEDLVAAETAAEIPEEYPYEAIRAQTILVRSRCMLRMKKEDAAGAIWNEIQEKNRNTEEKDAIRELCRKAAASTQQMVLTYGGNTVEPPFFLAGNGMTREGREVFGDDAYAWLVSVKNEEDLNSPDYIAGYTCQTEAARSRLEQELGIVLGEELFQELEVVKRDSAGYCMEIRVGEKKISGERFRQLLELPSACFEIQEIDGRIRFLCQGVGHGLGLCQYGSGVMAGKGKSGEEILAFYFPKLKIEKMRA